MSSKVCFLFAFIIGIFLRLYLISDQILLDDEWHGMDFVPGNSFLYVLTHLGSSANSIPMNLYRLLLLKTIGWSELFLRMPSVLAGAASLFVFPVFVKNIIGHRAAIIFSFFLAFSPVLIFYSRVSRGYSMVAFLGFCSIYFLYMWLLNKKHTYAILYILTGGLAIYFHLFALITVLAPLGTFFLINLFSSITVIDFLNINRIIPNLRYFFKIIFGLVIFLAALLLPAILNSPFPYLPSSDHVTMESFLGVISLLSGTPHKSLTLLFVFCQILGLILLFKKNPLLSIIIISLFVFNFLAVFVTKHSGIHNPIEIIRFCIVIVPVSYILISLSFDTAIEYVTRYGRNHKISSSYWPSLLLTIFFPLVFFFSGPLLILYSGITNFTNHSAFQESYEPLSWDQSYKSKLMSGYIISEKDVSMFYKALAKDHEIYPIIEYPMFIGDHFNPYYYYQRFHRKKVNIGYIANLKVAYPSKGYVFGNMTVDVPLSRVPDISRLKFRNMTDMLNPDAIKASQARYIVLHKNLMEEISGPFRKKNKVDTTVILLNKHYAKLYEPHFYEDNNIIVYKVPDQ